MAGEWPWVSVVKRELIYKLLVLGQSALLVGATGATGKYLLKELLSSPHFTRVGEYGRKVTPLEQIASGKKKLEQKVVDFENLEDAGLNTGNWDVVFITYYFANLNTAPHVSDTCCTGLEPQKMLLDRLLPLRKLTESELSLWTRCHILPWLIQIRRYVVSVAHAAKTDTSQRLVYLSVSLSPIYVGSYPHVRSQSAGSNPSSHFLYPR